MDLMMGFSIDLSYALMTFVKLHIAKVSRCRMIIFAIACSSISACMREKQLSTIVVHLDDFMSLKYVLL